MAVIVSNGDTNLSTASGFYRSEASNLGMFNATQLSLSSARTIPVTFANAGNCQGLIICLFSTSTSALKDVTVKLQENVASVWTDRASVTLTAATITSSTTSQDAPGWIVPFEGGTFPYAVDTAASKWRFEISNATGTNNWSIRTSDGTNPFYITWCDNAVSFTNNDVLVCKDYVTVDQTASVKGVLGTGDTQYGVATIVCSSSDPTPANVSKMLWGSGGAYTFTIDGLLVLGAHSGFRAGTSASRITAANMGHLTFVTRTVGTQASGVIGPTGSASVVDRKASFFIYGEIPTYERTTLTSDAAVSATSLSVADSTGWVNGDTIAVGKQNVAGQGNTSTYTVSSVSGTTINLTSGILANLRKAGGHVVRLNGYGFRISMQTTATWWLKLASNIVISGCQMSGFNITNSFGNNAFSDDADHRSQYHINHCSATSMLSSDLFATVTLPNDGCLIEYFNGIGVQVSNSTILFTQSSANRSSPLTVQHNVFLSCNAANASPGYGAIIQDNFWENGGSGGNNAQTLSAPNITFKDNYLWGGNSSSGFVQLQGMVNPADWSGNTYNLCARAVQFVSGSNLNIIATNDIFGDESANTIDIAFSDGVLAQAEFASPTGSINVSTSNITETLEGTHLRISDFNDTTGDDRGYTTYGFFQRTGSGRSDTTARTAGGQALRFQPNSGSDLLKFMQTVPTGDIEDLTMTITVWVYINNSSYAAGIHTKPQLTVKYDNTTTMTATATAAYGSWQQLAVTFTPATDYGQIIVTIQGATDATGSNAYFYVDDFNVGYPAGVQVNLGGLDLWANAMPVVPTIATFPSLAGVWDEPMSAHNVSGSFGEKEQKDLTLSKFLALK